MAEHKGLAGLSFCLEALGKNPFPGHWHNLVLADYC